MSDGIKFYWCFSESNFAEREEGETCKYYSEKSQCSVLCKFAFYLKSKEKIVCFNEHRRLELEDKEVKND
jgi:hypothetical protein